MHVLESIRAWLSEQGVAYRELEHEPTRTSEDSARVRGEELSIGGKALLLKVDDAFGLFVMSAALRVDSGAIRKKLNARRSRFATSDELFELTGLVPGSVPPFGRPILPFDLYVDESIGRNERIAFNAGSLEHSIFLQTGDYLRIAQPEIFRFARE